MEGRNIIETSAAHTLPDAFKISGNAAVHRVCVIDPPNDCDDQFGIVAIGNEIANGDLAAENISFIVTGALPELAKYQVYLFLKGAIETALERQHHDRGIATREAKKLAGKIIILSANTYGSKYPIAEDCVISYSGTPLTQADKDEVRQEIINSQGENSHFFKHGNESVAEYVQHLSERRMIELCLCARSSDWIFSIKPSSVYRIVLQGQVTQVPRSTQFTLGGSNHPKELCSNLVYRGELTN